VKTKEVKRLEKELFELKTQSEANIDNFRKQLLMSESEGQRRVMEYQRQCGNKIKFLYQLIDILNYYKHYKNLMVIISYSIIKEQLHTIY
jgi:hypothetical protein